MKTWYFIFLPLAIAVFVFTLWYTEVSTLESQLLVARSGEQIAMDILMSRQWYCHLHGGKFRWTSFATYFGSQADQYNWQCIEITDQP